MIVSDWLWVSRQRAEGKPFTFVPFSSAVGSLMVPADSPIRSLADLKGKKIAIAGGPLDKGWLLLRGLTERRHGFDPATAGEPVFGAPRSEEHTSELQSLMRISYAVFCLNKKTYYTN